MWCFWGSMYSWRLARMTWTAGRVYLCFNAINFFRATRIAGGWLGEDDLNSRPGSTLEFNVIEHDRHLSLKCWCYPIQLTNLFKPSPVLSLDVANQSFSMHEKKFVENESNQGLESVRVFCFVLSGHFVGLALVHFLFNLISVACFVSDYIELIYGWYVMQFTVQNGCVAQFSFCCF